MSFSIYIPARMQSHRLPGKPLRLYQGKPVLQHVIEHAKEANPDRLTVLSDSLDLQPLCDLMNVELYLDRNPYCCGTEAVRGAVLSLKDSSERIINLQGDEVDLSAEDIQRCANHRPDYTTMFYRGTQKEYDDRNKVKLILNAANHAIFFSRSPIPYRALPDNILIHRGIYGFSNWGIRDYKWIYTPEDLEQWSILYRGRIIHCLECAPGHSINVETDLFQ